MNKKFLIALIVMLLVLCTGFTFIGSAVHSVFADVNLDIDDENSVVKIMGNIHIPEGKVIKEDVVAVMGNVEIDGTVHGDVVAVRGNLIVNGNVGGNAVAVMGNVTANDIVAGDVVCVLGKIIKGPNGKILGNIVETNQPLVNVFGDSKFNIHPFGESFHWGFKIFNVILLFGLAALVLAFMPTQVKTMAEALGNDPLRKLFVGFIALILTPVLVLITAVSIVGIPLVPFLILGFIAAKFIGYVAVAFFVGNRIKNTANFNINIFLELLIGVLLLWLIKLIPFVGFLTSLVVTIFALGLVLSTKFGTNRPWFKKKEF